VRVRRDNQRGGKRGDDAARRRCKEHLPVFKREHVALEGRIHGVFIGDEVEAPIDVASGEDHHACGHGVDTCCIALVRTADARGCR
jgi:hypothetical protein